MGEDVARIDICKAFENILWMLDANAEPNRLIDVRMTYEDLKIIYKMAVGNLYGRKSERIA